MPSKRVTPLRRKAKQERARQTVQVLLEAAARVLAQHGYASATTNRIAATAGTSVGTLYEYFANKEEVYDALIQREIEALVSSIKAVHFDPEASLHDTLTVVLSVAMNAIWRGPSYLRSLEHVPGAVFRRRLLGARESVLAFIRQLLELHRKEIKVANLDLAAFMAVSSAEGIAANASDDQFDGELVEEISTMLSRYLLQEGGDGR